MLSVTCDSCGYEYQVENSYEIEAECLVCGVEHDVSFGSRGRVRANNCLVRDLKEELDADEEQE